MPEPQRDESAPGLADKRPRREIRYDAVAAVIAALVGMLALLVAGYTAYIQRQQVRAQVWPWLVAGNNDNERSIEILNKGVGPAIVRSAQVFVDGKPQPDWQHVLKALGTVPHTYSQSTLNPNVLTPGEKVPAIQFADEDEYRRFKSAALLRLTLVNICYCSTLDECWMYSDKHAVGYKSLAQLVRPIDRCPKLPDNAIFNN